MKRGMFLFVALLTFAGRAGKYWVDAENGSELVGATLLPRYGKSLVKVLCLALCAVALGAFGASSGGIYFNASVEVDGVVYPAKSTIYASSWPTQLVVRPVVPSGQTFQWYSTFVPRATYINRRSSENSFYGSLAQKFPVVRIPKMDGTYIMTPPGDSSVVITNTAVYAEKVVYVSPDGVDAASSGSEASPFKTIQYAIDYLHTSYSSAYAMVLVKPGTYDEGGYDGDSDNFRSRVYVYANQRVRIKSTDGAAFTFIDGEIDSSTANGCGASARRCVTFHVNGDGNACIQGFTFRNGRTAAANGQSYLNQGGGIGAQRTNYATSQHIAADCVFTNCIAGYSYNAAWNMWLFRCHVTDCGAGATGSDYLSATLVDGPGSGNIGSLAWQSSGVKFGLMTFNSIGGSQRLGPGGYYYGTVSTANGKDGTNLGYTWTTDYVVNLSGGDLRPVAGSAAEFGAAVPAAGTDDWYCWSDVMAELACGDVNGDKVLWNEGVPMSGAIMNAVTVHDATITIPATVGLDATGISGVALGATSVTAKIPVGEGFTLAPNTNGTRYASAVVHKGVTNLFANLPGGVYSFTAGEGSEALTFEVLYSRDWYVDDLGAAADSNKGFTPESPKGTLAGVMALASNGDTVHALPGTYAEGTMRNSGAASNYMRSRVVVPSGVTLISTEGPEKTVILGADATAEGGPVDAYGCGSNAVRCAYIRSKGVVSGFTLAGGRVNYLGSDYDDVSNGGGARGDYGGQAIVSTVENCIVSNCAARIGGAGHWVRFVGCRLFDNVATHSSALGWYTAFIDSIAASNRSSNGTSAFRFNDVVNSTFGPDYKLDGTTLASAFYENYYNKLFVNNVVYGGVSKSSGTVVASNCFFVAGSNMPEVGCQDVAWADLKLDASLRPAKDSPCVDAGIDEVGDLASCDAYAVPRILNGTIDIGGVEYDWRKDYSADISASGMFEVTAASPAVVESASKTVVIPNGASVTGNWTVSSVPKQGMILVRLTGSGTFSVTVGGKTVATLVGPTSGAKWVTFETSGTDAVTFSFVGTGSAELVKTRFAGTIRFLYR